MGSPVAERPLVHSAGFLTPLRYCSFVNREGQAIVKEGPIWGDDDVRELINGVVIGAKCGLRGVGLGRGV